MCFTNANVRNKQTPERICLGLPAAELWLLQMG